jgi:hypothetical protein
MELLAGSYQVEKYVAGSYITSMVMLWCMEPTFVFNVGKKNKTVYLV